MATPQTETAKPPTITADDVREATDAGSFKRGQDYVLRGMLYRPVRRGAALSAMSHGSSGGPYHVRATLAGGRDPIPEFACTCERGGFCKHIVALLLTWIADQAAFDVRQSLDELLADRSRDDLLDLIRKLVAVEPGLEAVLERQLPAAPVTVAPAQAGEAALLTAPIAAIRRKLDDAIDSVRQAYEDDWYNDDAEAEFEDVNGRFDEAIAAGAAYERAGRFVDAAAVYAAVATMGIDRYEDLYDSDEVRGRIIAAGGGLVRCLGAQAGLAPADRMPAGERIELLNAVYEVWMFAGHGRWEAWDEVDVDDAIGEFADDDLPGADVMPIVVDALTADERTHLDRRWRAEASASGGEAWRRRTALAFGVQLKGRDTVPDDELLGLLATAELWEDHAMLLLASGRLDEAVATAARRLPEPPVALRFADALVARGDDGRQRAIRFVDERLWETEGKEPRHDLLYLGWLARVYAAGGDDAKALDAEERAFKLAPDFPHYRAVRAAATRPGIPPERWPQIRKRALATLKQQENLGALMEVHLAEGEIADAIALLDRKPAGHTRTPGFGIWWGGVSGYRERVAAAATVDFPDDAIRIYRGLADGLIANRQRTAYHQAAKHVVAIRRIYDATGRAEEWAAFIRALREEHRRLPALQQELAAAGLT